METTFNRIITLAIIVGMIVLTATMLTQKSFGSVNDSSASYNSTTTRAFPAGTALTSPTTLSAGFGSVGSVVITGAATGVIVLYDATTTGPHSDHATTTIASFPASTAAGTYVLDARYDRGLVYVLEGGTVGTSTITWKK